MSTAVYAGPDPRHTPEGILRFLFELGFEDYSAQAERNIAAPRSIGSDPGPLASEVLRFNAERYKIIDNARDISAQVMSRMGPKLADPAIRSRAIEATARLLAMQPIGIPDQFPPEIAGIVDGGKRDEAVVKYLTGVIQDDIRKSARQVHGDLVHAAYGEKYIDRAIKVGDRAALTEIDELFRKVLLYTKQVYLDPEVGRTRYLGRAMAAVLVRESRIAKGPDAAPIALIEKELKKAALKNGQFLENYVGDKVKFVDSKGIVQSVKIQNGAFLMERSLGKEAHQLSSSIAPGTMKGKMQAWYEKLLGYHFLGPLIADEEALQKKVARGEPTTKWEAIKKWVTNRNIARTGYSHMGTAVVKSDVDNLVSMAWAMDNYPNAERGGIRFVGIAEQFAHDGQYIRFGLVTYDPAKFYSWAKEQYQKNGYVETVWESTEMGKDGRPVAGTEGKYQWKTRISQEEVERILQAYDPRDPAKWYQKEIVSRAQLEMKDMMVSRGTAFGYGFQDCGNSAWCTKSVEIAFKSGTGFDPIPEPDRVLIEIKGLKGSGPRTTAPASPAWQKLRRSHESVSFQQKNTLERLATLHEPAYLPMNPRLTAKLEQVVHEGEVLSELTSKTAVETIATFIRDTQLEKGGSGVRGYAGEALQGRSGRISADSAPVDFSHKRTPLALQEISQIDRAALRHEMLGFLDRLGLQDYSGMAEKALREKGFVNEIGRLTLAEKIRSYEMISAARKIATYIMSGMDGRLSDLESRQRLAEVTAKLLDMKPLAPPQELPVHIRTLPAAKRGDAIIKYIEGITRQQVLDHADAVVSDIITTLYGESNTRAILKEGRTVAGVTPDALRAEIQELFKDVHTYVERMYFEPTIGKSKFLGRAMALLTERAAHMKNDPAIRKELEEALGRRGKKLQNVTGDTLEIAVDGGKAQSIRVKNGAFVMIRSTDRESAAISSSALPANTKRAKEFGLKGSLLQAAIGHSNEAYVDGVSAVERLAHKLNQNERFTKGFSHIGFMVMNEDVETGIKHLMVVDNLPYPTADSFGGIRVLTLDHFADQSHYSKIGIAEVDDAKFMKFAQKQMRQKGYGAVSFPAFELTLDEYGEILENPKAKSDDWKPRVTKEEWDALLAEKDPKFFGDKVWRGITDHMIYTDGFREGTFFDWPFARVAGKICYNATYCSSLGVKAGIVRWGIDLQAQADKWAGQIKFLQKAAGLSDRIGLKKVKDLPGVSNAVMIDLDARVVAPSGLIAQDYVEKFTTANFTDLSLEEMAKHGVAPPPAKMNSDVTALVRGVVGKERQAALLAPIPEREVNALAKRVLLEVMVPKAVAAGQKGATVVAPPPAEAKLLRVKGNGACVLKNLIDDLSGQ